MGVCFLFGALKGTRTPDPLLRRQMLYPAELSAHFAVCLTARTILTQTLKIIKHNLRIFMYSIFIDNESI